MKRLIPLCLVYVLINQGGTVSKAIWSDGQPVDGFMQERQIDNPDLTYQIVDQQTFDNTILEVPVKDVVSKNVMSGPTIDLTDPSIPLEDRFQVLINKLGVTQ